jgi:hypothetical protein
VGTCDDAVSPGRLGAGAKGRGAGRRAGRGEAGRGPGRGEDYGPGVCTVCRYVVLWAFARARSCLAPSPSYTLADAGVPSLMDTPSEMHVEAVPWPEAAPYPAGPQSRISPSMSKGDRSR